MYQLLENSTCVRRVADNTFIPPDPLNSDWQAYQAWLKAGNTPANPAAAPTAATAKA